MKLLNNRDFVEFEQHQDRLLQSVLPIVSFLVPIHQFVLFSFDELSQQQLCSFLAFLELVRVRLDRQS